MGWEKPGGVWEISKVSFLLDERVEEGCCGLRLCHNTHHARTAGQAQLARQTTSREGPGLTRLGGGPGLPWGSHSKLPRPSPAKVCLGQAFRTLFRGGVKVRPGKDGTQHPMHTQTHIHTCPGQTHTHGRRLHSRCPQHLWSRTAGPFKCPQVVAGCVLGSERQGWAPGACIGLVQKWLLSSLVCRGAHLALSFPLGLSQMEEQEERGCAHPGWGLLRAPQLPG